MDINLENSYLGIELGSTRIKAVLINDEYEVLASGAHDWENQYINSFWTYSLEMVWQGIQDAYAILAQEVQSKYGKELTKLGAIGVSGMMHGYLPFDRNGNQLAEFRTWRNTNTEPAANKLTTLLGFNIPQRWSVAHIYQAILNNEPHTKEIEFLTTLAGYVHWRLTGEKIVGIGEASGMFPIDSDKGIYHQKMQVQFNELLAQNDMPFTMEQIFPKILKAGERAGKLTKEGARLLDPTEKLSEGIAMCAPEGDAGTGMIATNSIAPLTGNVSAGTSVFAMIVLQKTLSKVYTAIDMVTTPSGSPVAMVHCNTCTSDLDAWIKLISEAVQAAGASITKPQLYDLFYQKALEASADCGGLVNYNYYSGEPVTGVENGCPMFMRSPSAKLTLANFARCQLYSTMATLKIGMDILFKDENVHLEKLLGHGGLFKTPVVGQKLMAGALGVPVAVMTTAGEGGPWGIAVLAAYMAQKSSDQSLEDYLSNNVFASTEAVVLAPDEKDIVGFDSFIHLYKNGLNAEISAANALKQGGS